MKLTAQLLIEELETIASFGETDELDALYIRQAIEAVKALQLIAEKAGTDNPYEYGGIYDDHWCADQAKAVFNE